MTYGHAWQCAPRALVSSTQADAHGEAQSWSHGIESKMGVPDVRPVHCADSPVHHRSTRPNSMRDQPDVPQTFIIKIPHCAIVYGPSARMLHCHVAGRWWQPSQHGPDAHSHAAASVPASSEVGPVSTPESGSTWCDASDSTFESADASNGVIEVGDAHPETSTSTKRRVRMSRGYQTARVRIT